MATLFSDFLSALDVKHTEEYSDQRFESMPFQSLFGLTKLLQEYGVDSQGLKATDKSVFTKLPLPFLADTQDGFTIVTQIVDGRVSYMSQGKSLSAPLEEFLGAWNGIALVAQPTPKAIEPEYGAHHRVEIFNVVKKLALKVLAAAVIIFLLIFNWKWENWSSILIAIFDCAGVYVSWMLVQKSLNIKNAKADAVCSVLQEGGCDTIAKSEASSFLGIVKWSEVGLAYFSVSFLALMLFPCEAMPWLALINACCLPYTVWSIVYQKFVAKTWCTLCVTVQALLWLLFISYLVGGWWSGIWHNWIVFILLVAAYAIALLAINTFDNALSRLLKPQKED